MITVQTDVYDIHETNANYLSTCHSDIFPHLTGHERVRVLCSPVRGECAQPDKAESRSRASTTALFAQASAALGNSTHKENTHDVSAGSVSRCNNTGSNVTFNTTRTYRWRGEATGWRAATGTFRGGAGVHRHRDRAGWGRNTDEWSAITRAVH